MQKIILILVDGIGDLGIKEH